MDDEDDDDDDVQVISKPAKKETDRRPTKRKASAINDEDDDDDDTRNKLHVQRSPKKETASSIPKASPKRRLLQHKIHCSYQKSKVPAGGDSTADTAQEILATIPDAELPEVDPTKRLTSLL